MNEKEWVWHISCGSPQELEELRWQLRRTNDGNTKKQLQQKFSMTQAKREVAASKAVRQCKNRSLMTLHNASCSSRMQ